MNRNQLDCFAKSPLILSFSAPARLGELASFAAASGCGCGRGEGTPKISLAEFKRTLSPPHPLVDVVTLDCKLGKPSLQGERQSEGVFCLRRALATLALILICCAPCRAELSPNQLREIEMNPSPGAALPLDAGFATAGNGGLSLKDALGGKPAVLMLVDFKCRFTCGTALAIAADGLSRTGLEPGRDYNFLVIGIDPKAIPADAEAMKAAYLAPYPRLLASAKFLSGSAGSIESVTAALNYKAVYDAGRREYVHPLGVVIVTGTGRVSHVIEGLNLSAAPLRAAILDARKSKLSALLEGIRLLCYGHNPLQGAYTSTVQAALEGGALLTVLSIGGALAFFHRRKGARS